MLNEEEIKRYTRQIQLPDIGLEGQLKLKQARVLVIGAGGLGCPLVQYLAAAGIGHLCIVDGDTVAISNLQRQILYTTEDVGKSKALLAATYARKLNPHIQVEFRNEFISLDLALELFAQYDLVADCSDNFGTRYLINDVCVLLGKPFVAAALFRYEGQLGMYNVLQQDGTYSASFRDVFPVSDEKNLSLDCNAAGVFSVLPGIMALYQTNELIHYFLHREECLINQLLLFNCKKLNQQVLEIIPRSGGVAKTLEEIKNTDYIVPCNQRKEEYQFDDFLFSEDAILVDVREYDEQPELATCRHLKLPLSELEAENEMLLKYRKLLFICKSGVRSKLACTLIQKQYPHLICYAYKSGIDALLHELEDRKELNHR